jgi:hypothetical protein
MVGRWEGDRGLFLATDQDADGARIDVRFVWTRDGRDHAGWEQAFSHDEGESWDVNWTMDMVRRG